MKKKARTLIVLGAVLIVCIGAYIGVSVYNNNQAKKTAEETKATQIYSTGRGAPVNVSYTSGDKTLAFTLADNTWYVKDNKDFPLDQAALTGIASTLQSLAAARTIDTPSALSVYGLDKPQYTLTAADAGGNALTLLIGAVNGSNYYAMTKDGTKVYTIDGTLIGDLKPDYLSMITLDTIPSITEATMTALTVSSGKTSLTLDHHQNKDGSFTWFIVNGKTVTSADEFVLPVKSDKSTGKFITDLVTGLSSAKFSSCADFKPASDVLKTYGLDAPKLTVKVDYTTTTGAGTLDQKTTASTVSLEVGTALSDGSGSYARLPGSNEINVLPATVVTPLTDALAAMGSAI